MKSANRAEGESLAVLVRIPTPLQRLTDGEREVRVEQGTVASVIEELEAKFPGMRERVIDDSGEIRRFVNIYVEEEDVRFLSGLATEVADGVEVSIVPAVAGGSL